MSVLSFASIGGCSVFEQDTAQVSDSMLVEVLVDLHIASARERFGYDGTPEMRDSILHHHGIDEEAFRETIQHYADHPSEYVELYQDVLDRIIAEQSGMSRWMKEQSESDTTDSSPR